MLQDALLSPFALPPPLPRGPHLLPLSSNDLQQQLISSPATLDFPPNQQEQKLAHHSAMGVTRQDDDAAEEDEEVQNRRLEGERKFREAQELAAQKRRDNSAGKENRGASASPVRPTNRSASCSPVKSRRSSPVGVREVTRRTSAAWEAQERLHDEARWSGRAFGGAGWYALLGEGVEWYAEDSVVWVRAGEDEMSIRNMGESCSLTSFFARATLTSRTFAETERLKAEAQRGNSAAVYLIWKTLTREAYYQKAGITDARVARQLAAE